MKKKEIDEGYIVGAFYILKNPVEDGYLHVINIKTMWQFKVYMGSNIAYFLKLPEQVIDGRLTGIYIQSMISLYDNEYALKIAKDAQSYLKKKAKETNESDENKDISKLKKDECMLKIASASDKEIMDMIINGEIEYEYFKD